VVGAFLRLEVSSTTSFRVGLTFAVRPGNPPALAALLSRTADVRVTWVGVEMARGCPPSLAGGQIITLAGAAIDPAPWLTSLALLGVLDS
jgi:hypothetical protein